MARAEEIDLAGDRYACIDGASFNVTACDDCARVQEIITKYILRNQHDQQRPKLAP